MKPVATGLGPVFAFPSNSCNRNQTDHQRARTATAVRSFFGPVRFSLRFFCDRFSLPVGMEQRRFGDWRDLDYSTPRVQWLCTPLCGKAKAQGTRLSKPKKKGTCPIRNSRGLAAQVWMTSVRFGQGIGHLPVSVT